MRIIRKCRHVRLRQNRRPFFPASQIAMSSSPVKQLAWVSSTLFYSGVLSLFLSVPKVLFLLSSSTWKKISPCLIMPNSLRARSSMASKPCLRSRTSASSVAFRIRNFWLISCCVNTCWSNSHTLSQLPLPSHSGYCSRTIRAASRRPSTFTSKNP